MGLWLQLGERQSWEACLSPTFEGGRNMFQLLKDVWLTLAFFERGWAAGPLKILGLSKVLGDDPIPSIQFQSGGRRTDGLIVGKMRCYPTRFPGPPKKGTKAEKRGPWGSRFFHLDDFDRFLRGSIATFPVTWARPNFGDSSQVQDKVDGETSSNWRSRLFFGVLQFGRSTCKASHTKLQLDALEYAPLTSKYPPFLRV